MKPLHLSKSIIPSCIASTEINGIPSFNKFGLSSGPSVTGLRINSFSLRCFQEKEIYLLQIVAKVIKCDKLV